MQEMSYYFPYPGFVVSLVRGVQDKSSPEAWPLFVTVATSPHALAYDELRQLFPEIGTDKFLQYLFEISIGFGMCGFGDCGENTFHWKSGKFLKGKGIDSVDEFLVVWHTICSPQKDNLRAHWKHERERWGHEKVGDILWNEAKDRLGILDPINGGLGRSFV